MDNKWEEHRTAPPRLPLHGPVPYTPGPGPCFFRVGVKDGDYDDTNATKCRCDWK